MESENCPECGCPLEDITIVDDLPTELAALYEAGHWGLYECRACGWNDVIQR